MSHETGDWNGIVNVVLYCLQFEPLTDNATARKLASMLVEEPLWTLTASQEYEILTVGLNSREPIPSVIRTEMIESEIVDFLTMIVSNMNDLRPWPDLPFLCLPDERLTDFVSLTPKARTNIEVSEIEDEIGYSFDYDSDYGEFLLIRLKSGIEVGFLNPLASDGDNADIVCNARDASAKRILDELVDATGLERGIFTERR